MITIKINGENKNIPVFDELTVNQFIEANNKLKNDSLNIIEYLSIATDINYKVIFNLNIKENNINTLKNVIGNVKDYTKIKPKKELIINKSIYKVKEIETLGQRYLIENNVSNLDDEELFCFILTISLLNKDDLHNTDFEIINDLKNQIMNSCYLDILPIAYYISKNFFESQKKKMNIFKRLSNMIRIAA